MAASEDRVSAPAGGDAARAPAALPNGGGDGSAALRAQNIPRTFYHDANGRSFRDIGPREMAEVVAKGTGALWVDIDSTNRNQHGFLE